MHTMAHLCGCEDDFGNSWGSWRLSLGPHQAPQQFACCSIPAVPSLGLSCGFLLWTWKLPDASLTFWSHLFGLGLAGAGGVCLFCFIFLGFAVVALIHENIQTRTTLSKTAQPQRKPLLVLSESTIASLTGLIVVCLGLISPGRAIAELPKGVQCLSTWPTYGLTVSYSKTVIKLCSCWLVKVNFFWDWISRHSIPHLHSVFVCLLTCFVCWGWVLPCSPS